MVETSPLAIRLLSETGAKCSKQYREICRIISGFGYCSIDEIKYHVGLNEREAVNRLWYLTQRAGILKKFPSDTYPRMFYCLSSKGRGLVKQFGVSEYTSDFVPSRYNLLYQRHHRLLIKVWSRLTKFFGEKYAGYITDEMLRKEGWRRVFDAELILRVDVDKYKEDDWGTEFYKHEWEYDYWGIELETTLKSPGRYEKQTQELSNYLSDRKYKKGAKPLSGVIYFFNHATIQSRLQMHLKRRYIEEEIYFVNLDKFLAGEIECFNRYSMIAELKNIVRSRRVIYDAEGKVKQVEKLD